MTIDTIITLISVVLSSGILLTIFTFREKKLLEKIKVRQEGISANKSEFSAYQEQIIFLSRQVRDLQHKDAVKERKLFGMQRFLVSVIGRKNYAELHFCKKDECLGRDPVLGSFSTDDSSIEEIIDTAKDKE